MAGAWKPESIRRDRAAAFRREIMPYIRYMGQSGFPGFLSLVFIVSAIGYGKLISDLSPNFPVAATGVVVLTPVLCWSPLRTLLRPADTVYLMPREHEMGMYLRGSLLRSARLSFSVAAVVLLLYMPIYRQGVHEGEAAILVLAAIALKLVNAAGAWRERQLNWSSQRTAYRWLRWLLTAAVIGMALSYSWWIALGLVVLAVAAMTLLYRLPNAQGFPWERLIEEEENTRRRMGLFFSMFIDVPVVSSRVKRRSYLAWLLPTISFSRSRTFQYLYAATLFRTEIGGILVRLLLLGGTVVFWAAGEGYGQGWGAALAYMLFLLIYFVQLGSLRHSHRYTVWKQIYPLPERQHMDGVMSVDRWASLTGAILLWLPCGITLFLQGIALPAVAALAGVLLYAGMWRPSRLRVRMEKELDEDA
ncbi:ABC transporter permease [Paenibacillus sp. J5C_2022]|uniref:ABC transporter permease n=1 Tax=Paenibacillus sp. J5C2022 TaxID=2977129 RepID=UPI0021D0787B|nr:ABC transporter permease [Paenibacillus sp. J5C2022]MCU6710267.1 ABC transporter permease [Paenibacillus sp. J5C2022]